jgi:hypothetical protein
MQSTAQYRMIKATSFSDGILLRFKKCSKMSPRFGDVKADDARKCHHTHGDSEPHGQRPAATAAGGCVAGVLVICAGTGGLDRGQGVRGERSLAWKHCVRRAAPRAWEGVHV